MAISRARLTAYSLTPAQRAHKDNRVLPASPALRDPLDLPAPPDCKEYPVQPAHKVIRTNRIPR